MTKFNVVVRYDKHYCRHNDRVECDYCEHYDDYDGCTSYMTVVEAFSATGVSFAEDALPHEIALEIKINNKKSINISKSALLYFELNGKVYYEYKELANEVEQKEINIFKKIQELIPMPPPIDILHIKQFMEEGMEDQLLCEAVDITLENKDIKSSMDRWKYFKGIIRYWYNDGIKTYEELKNRDK